MSIFLPAHWFFAAALLRPLGPARRRLAMFSDIATALHSNRAVDRVTHPVLFGRDADRLPLRATVARASLDLCLPKQVPTLPSAIPNPRTCAGTLRLRHSNRPGSRSKS